MNYMRGAGGVNTALQPTVYGKIADEIYDKLWDAPEVVAVLISNGT